MLEGILNFREVPQDKNVMERIEHDLQNNDIVLFLKGTKMFPQCGYSAAVVEILDEIGVTYKDIDILSDPVLSRAIKEYTDWPNTPQLYVKGKFVGGCDKVRDIYVSGELQNLLNENQLIE